MTVTRWAPLAGAVTSLAVSSVLLVIAVGTKQDATRALENAERLYDAQVSVAEAQEELEGTDLRDAITAARAANETALRVGDITEDIVGSLAGAERTVSAMLRSSRRGASNAVFARDQAEVAARILAAISSYQGDAVRSSGVTNAALRRVLKALRETNRSLPGLR